MFIAFKELGKCRGINKYIVFPITPYALSKRRLRHVHLDIVSMIPRWNNNKYLVTCIDRFIRWPEIWSIDNVSAHTIIAALVTNWISRFRVIDFIITRDG